MALPRLLIVGASLAAVFPSAIGLALRSVSASHAAVVMAGVPLATAAYARLRGYERPGMRFWIAGTIASALAAVFCALHATGAGAAERTGDAIVADLLLALAAIAAAVGYVEGGRAARERPGWAVISWALVLMLPASLAWSAALIGAAPAGNGAVTMRAWAGLAYGALFSMYLGFFPWYHALHRIGVARASQIQYAQPFLTIAYGWWLLGERLGPWDLALALGVVLAIAWGRSSIRQTGVINRFP